MVQLMSRRRALIVSFGLAVVALSAAGAVLAPSWQRPRLDPRGFEAPAAAPRTGPLPAPSPTRREDIAVAVAGDRLRATVVAPGDPGPHPAVVLVPGAGPATRDRLLGLAEALARSGIVALTYDKRTAGYTFTDRDYGQLADDARTLAGGLRERVDVDPARVGLWGISEGGWVVPLAAARDPDIAFAILVSAPTMSPGAQLSWAVDDGLRRAGAPPGARRFAARALALGGTNYVHYDPVPALREVDQPVLALYGTEDRAVPPVQSAQILVDTLAGSGNRALTIRFFAGADHGLRVGGDLAPGYLETMVTWIGGLPGTPAVPPLVAGARADQPYAAALPPVPWYAGGRVVAAGYGLVVAGYGTAFPAAWVARRRPGGAAAAPGTWRAVWRPVRRMALGGAALAIFLNLAMGALVALGLLGGPGWIAHAVWLIIRLLALGVVGLAVVAGRAALVAGAGGWRPGRPARLAVGGAGGATAITLVLAAYWGLFAPQW